MAISEARVLYDEISFMVHILVCCETVVDSGKISGEIQR
jgi:hypothetical protein